MNLLKFRPMFCFMPDGTGGGDSSTEGEGESGESRSNPEVSFQRTLDRRGNSLEGVTALARELYDDNYQQRRQLRSMTKRVETAEASLREKTVLSEEEAAKWAAYQALGTPDELKERVEQHATLQGELATLKRDETLRQMAEAAGFRYSVLRSQDALETKVNGKTITYELREVDEDGVKVKRPFIKDGDTEKPLAEYAQENWADLMPSLAVSQEASPTQSRGQMGTPFPSQHQGAGTGRVSTPIQQTKATLDKQYKTQSRDTT